MMETGHLAHHHAAIPSNGAGRLGAQLPANHRKPSVEFVVGADVGSSKKERRRESEESAGTSDSPTWEQWPHSHAIDTPPPTHWASSPLVEDKETHAHSGIHPAGRSEKPPSKPKMIRIFEPLDFKDAKPKRKQHPYEVKPGDTLAGIALRHGMKEAEVRAMNNLWEGNVFAGQKLVLHRKLRSQSLPSISGGKAIAERVRRERAANAAKESEQRRRVEATHPSQAHEEPVADDEQPLKKAPQPESKGRSSLGAISEQSPHAPQPSFFSSLFGWSGATPSPTMKVVQDPKGKPPVFERTRRLKARSYSERLPTNQEEDKEVYALPKLRGAIESDVLSDARYGPKLVPKIEAFLPMRLRGYDWSMLYSLAQHGSSLQTLMRNTRGQRSTLIVVETCKGEIFGGFATTAWASSMSYYGSGESFVFTTVPAFEVFNWKKTNSMFMFSNNESIAMGGGGGFAWFLNEDLSQGSTASCETYGNRPLTTEPHFDVANVEVWGFKLF